MDALLIAALVVAALVLLTVLVMSRRSKTTKRRRRDDAHRERYLAEKHKARADVSDELLRERTERDRLESEVHALRARELDPD